MVKERAISYVNVTVGMKLSNEMKKCPPDWKAQC